MRVFAGLLCLCVFLLQSGCAGWQASATRTEQYSAAVPSELIAVEGRNGSITVEGGDFGEVFVDAQLKAYGVSEEAAEAMLDEVLVKLVESEGTLRVFAEYPPGFRGSVGFVVKTPPGVAVDVNTGNGGVGVNGILRSVKAKTSNGRVEVKNAVGPVDVRTSNGSVEISTAEPTSVVAETSNGRIIFGGALRGEGNVLKTSNGSIELRLAGDATEISYKTSNGVVTFSGERAEREGSQVFGGDGETIASQLSARTSNGSITVSSLEFGAAIPSGPE